jgi:anti-sigma regulatory factor (Ser/Thr protein kinase)
METSGYAVHIGLNNDIADLEKLHREVDAFCSHIGVSKKCHYHLDLALDELFTNIVHYGYPQGGRHRIDLYMEYKAGICTFRLEDDGVPFNPLHAEPPDIEKSAEDRGPGGLGIFLTRKVMDEVQYERTDNKNVVTLLRDVRKGDPCKNQCDER